MAMPEIFQIGTNIGGQSLGPQSLYASASQRGTAAAATATAKVGSDFGHPKIKFHSAKTQNRH